MNYFQFHIGDYAAATSHLSILEDAIYSRLLRRYYSDEKPIPADISAACRLVGARSEDEREAVRAVLAEFFTLTEDGWRNARADREIDGYHRMKVGGAKGANARWGKAGDRGAITTPSEPYSPPHANPNANHEPLTSNQEPEQKRKGGRSAPVALAVPEWLPADAWEQWHRFRNARRGWTADAKALSLRTLTALREAGQDPRAVIEQSIERGWTGLFPVHDAGPARGRTSEDRAHDALREALRGAL